MFKSNLVVMVTGAGSGIGKAIAEAFLEEGCSVVLVGRNRGKLEKVARNTERLRGRAYVFNADVSVEDEVIKLFEETRRHFGRLDILFNNAGIFAPAASLEDVTLDNWNASLSVNLTGAFLCTKEAFKIMRQQDPQGGRIINNGSISAHAPRPGSAPYTASKHAMSGLTKATSLDGRRYNIACGQIDIGNAVTDMTRKMEQGILQPNGRIEIEPTMDVENVVRAVMYMASLPLDANVQFMTVLATKMPFIGRG
ncbi:SDR family oxidoreductase [Noviherbaspirillum pedocola]|uniref:SDR family oxidoreductase n=1 Tax=Noviherbaspirillum pedocola TaxID=2801341 RepID=A0A934T1G6_9BURK|nr:SDR family oxidoreductase [Noviherbaspirillum pedocola]MBK4739370.1 SDR family oxidoreductase [Noviherbaspirillum pedocola]